MKRWRTAAVVDRTSSLMGIHGDGIDVGGADRRPCRRGERWSCVKRWCAAVGSGPTGYGRQSIAGAGTRRSAMRHVPAALRACIGEWAGCAAGGEGVRQRVGGGLMRYGATGRTGGGRFRDGQRPPRSCLVEDSLALRKSFAAIRMDSGLAPPRRQSCSTQKKGGPKAAPCSRTIRDSFSCLILSVSAAGARRMRL